VLETEYAHGWSGPLCRGLLERDARPDTPTAESTAERYGDRAIRGCPEVPSAKPQGVATGRRVPTELPQ